MEEYKFVSRRRSRREEIDRFLRIISSSLLIFLVWTVESAPIVNSNTEAMMYLSQFGWLDPSMKKVGSEALIDIRRAIEDFQAFAGLNQTGEMDDMTVKMMSTPRCGVRDKIGHDARRRRRYALQGSRWKVRDLTYRVTKYPRNLDQGLVDLEVGQAFRVWEKEANLTFTHRLTGKVHIEIRFERREHGDGDAFDGEGGTLAHAYFPVYGGDAHFDDDEKWSIKSNRGTNLFQVAAHEFGHSLGLSHSDVRGALMAPFYRGYQPQFQLHEDDTLAIQALYGKKVPLNRAPTTKKPIKGGPSHGKGPSSENKLCINSQIDAITSMSDGHTYVFKGSDYYRLTDNGVADGYPQAINPAFGSLPSNLDAAFTWTNEKTYFFKGSKYWRFSAMQMDAGYPKEISDGFSGIPSNINTATVWSGNGKIYFFKGDQYWRFDPSRTPQVSLGYPKPISNWNGIPNNLDAALRYTNGYTYFFKSDKYWRFNDRSFGVDSADPPFPRVVGNWWYGCGKKQTMKTSGRPPSPDYQSDSGDAGEDGNSGSSSDVILTSNRLLTNLWIAFLLPFSYKYFCM